MTPAVASARPALPIDTLLPEIVRILGEHSSLVIEAEPGAGKTSRVPPLLLNLVLGQVLVLEPRRIAARLAAFQAARELGEVVGRTVGYQVRFDAAGDAETRLRFLTEGVLTKRLISDPDLAGVDAVVLDEFHERHLDTDLALSLLKKLQQRRPQLKLIVMSATLDAAPVAKFLGNCPVLRCPGRQYELEIRYQPYFAVSLEQQVCDSVSFLLHRRETKNILVFLPGAAEIRRCIRACEHVAKDHDAVLLPLYGDLAQDQQDRALASSLKRKIIVATNIAESSVTIEGVTAVVDSGLARIASYSPWNGLPALQVNRISKASANQRAGRAGRTAPGIAVRLYPPEDFAQRANHEMPAILRSDLSGLCLTLRAMELGGVDSLEWLDTPSEKAVQHAETLLDHLGITEGNCKELARLPVAPRLARMLVEATKRRVSEKAIEVAVLLGSDTKSEKADLWEALQRDQGWSADRQKRQLRALLRPGRTDLRDEDALLQSVLRGFPDRVAQRRADRQILMMNGTSVELAGPRTAYEYMVVLDVDLRSDRQMPVARMVARIEPEWLLDAFPEQLREDLDVAWNESTERIETASLLRFGALTLQESRDVRAHPEMTGTLLARQAARAGLGRFLDIEQLEQLQARIAFAGLPQPDFQAAVEGMCGGLRSFAELRSTASSLLPTIESQLGPTLERSAPKSLRLPAGRLVKVNYEKGKPPWVASRLQDFFGLTETPRLGPDRIPVVVHLLAPNQRAVQTTTDIGGFWHRLYPQVRRELMRRYPRHAWPEVPDGSAVKAK